MTMNRGAILVALLVLTACSELASIEPGICGNGVIEATEDCDSLLPHCSSCSLVCTSDADCMTLGGPGYVCGPDRLCHAPAGTFIHAAQVSVAVDAYRIANVNTTEDFFGDVIAQSGSSVTVLYGDFAGSLSTFATVQSPIAQGPVTFAKLDADSVPDVLIPTADGLAAFTFGLGVPAPYTFPKLLSEIPGGEPLMTFNIGREYLGGIIDVGGQLKLIVLLVGLGTEKVVASEFLCGAQVAEFSERRTAVHVLPTLQLAGGAPPPIHVVFSTILSSGGGDRVCAIALDEIGSLGPPISPFTLTRMPSPTPPLAAGERGVLVDVSGTGCPSLFVETAGGALLELPAQPTGAAVRPCQFAAATQIQRLDLGGGPKNGGAPLGFLALDAPDVGLVLTDGIYLYKPTALGGPSVSQFYASDRPLDRAEMLDLDDDGALDLVAMGKSSNDLDLLYQIPFPVPRMYGVLRVRFDTDETVKRVLPGDFDGNRKTDIAYVERVGEADRLMIAYGTSDRPLPGQAVGTFEDLFSLIQIDIPDSTDPFGVVSDLVVLYGRGAAKRLALLHGSPQRTMQAFFDPREELVNRPTASDDSELFAADLAGVIPGHFGGGGGHDILGLATKRHDATSSLYLTPTAPGGEISGAASCGYTMRLRRCEGVSDDQGSNSSTDLCTNLASYLAWPMSATRDVVIGIDGFGNAATFDPEHAGTCALGAIPDLTSANWSVKLGLTRRNVARRVRSIEVVASEPPELAVSFAPGKTGDPGDAAIRVCTIENGMAVSCEDPAVLVAQYVGAPAICSDLATGRATAVSRFGIPPPTVKDLFAVCQLPTGRFVYRLSRFERQTEVTELFPIGTADEIEVGDVNGDAIDDIVVLEREEGLLHVYTQCSSRNPADCEQVQIPVPGETNP